MDLNKDEINDVLKNRPSSVKKHSSNTSINNYNQSTIAGTSYVKDADSSMNLSSKGYSRSQSKDKDSFNKSCSSFNRSMREDKSYNVGINLNKDRSIDKMKNTIQNNLSNNLSQSKTRVYANKLRTNSRNFEKLDFNKNNEFKKQDSNSNIVSNIITSFSLDNENNNLLKSETSRSRSRSLPKSKSNNRFRAI